LPWIFALIFFNFAIFSSLHSAYFILNH
jgi:hypothetical protein